MPLTLHLGLTLFIVYSLVVLSVLLGVILASPKREIDRMLIQVRLSFRSFLAWIKSGRWLPRFIR